MAPVDGPCRMTGLSLWYDDTMIGPERPSLSLFAKLIEKSQQFLDSTNVDVNPLTLPSDLISL